MHHWAHSQKLGVRARQRRPFRAPPAMDQLTCTRFLWSRSTRLEKRTKESYRWACFFVGAAPRSACFVPRHKQPFMILKVVRARAQVFGVHVCVLPLRLSSFFFLPSLLSFSLSLSLSALVIIFIFVSIIIFISFLHLSSSFLISIFQWSLTLSMFFIFRFIRPNFISFYEVLCNCSVNLASKLTQKPSEKRG